MSTWQHAQRASKMTKKFLRDWQRMARRFARRLVAEMPTAWRFSLYRRAIDFAPPQGGTLELKIAESEAELEQCFSLLHDAYVASGFMRPHPSGLRVTPYHALPTTTTLCAKVDGRVVGTLSIVRDGIFGFPMQSAFDISSVRAKPGRIAEISALAIHPAYRRTGGSILFPLMKFMYEYCTKYFDTRHLLIAVNPNHIEMYESLLFFRRLTAEGVASYDFANGAPAVGATLDLKEAPAIFERAYSGKPGRRDLHRFFVSTPLPAIKYPKRPWNISNDPILTPALMHYFFIDRTDAFAELDDAKRRLLHAMYPGPEWARVLPPVKDPDRSPVDMRRHQRFSLTCPAILTLSEPALHSVSAEIIEVSRQGFRARSAESLAVGALVTAEVELGQGNVSRVLARVVHPASQETGLPFGFSLVKSDERWQECVAWLDAASSKAELGGHLLPPQTAGTATA